MYVCMYVVFMYVYTCTVCMYEYMYVCVYGSQNHGHSYVRTEM